MNQRTRWMVSSVATVLLIAVLGITGFAQCYNDIETNAGWGFAGTFTYIGMYNGKPMYSGPISGRFRWNSTVDRWELYENCCGKVWETANVDTPTPPASGWSDPSMWVTGGEAASCPDIWIGSGSTEIPNGGTKGPGSGFTVGQTADYSTVALWNYGTATLTVTSVTASNLVGCENFRLVSLSGSPGSTPFTVVAGAKVNPGLYSYFDITAESFSFDLTIVSDDPNDGTYTFTVSGTATNTAPTVTDVSVDTDPIADNDLTQVITVTFDEAMDTNVDPSITFSAGGPWTSANDGAWSNSDMTWTETFTGTDNDETVNGVTVDVSGAQDAYGKEQADYTPEAEFDIKTAGPTVVVDIVADIVTEEADSSEVTFTFSEATSDFTVDDLVVEGGTISGFSGTGASYTATFTGAPNTLTTGSVTVPAASFTNSVGNAGEVGADTVVVRTVPLITVNPTGEAGPDALLDVCIHVPEGEEPPTVGVLPLTAIHTVGDVVTGGCQIIAASGVDTPSSFIHIYTYSVDITVEPEFYTLIEHWTAPYDWDIHEFVIAWDTVGLEPGYYDLRLFFEDGTNQVFRIQLLAAE